MLDAIDLEELEKLKALPASEGKTPAIPDASAIDRVFVEAKQNAIDCLKHAERVFRKSSMARRSLSTARLAASLGNNIECLRLCDEALGLPDLEGTTKSEILFVRAYVFLLLDRYGHALADLTECIELPGAPVERVAKALYNRGVTWGQKGETDKELTDYTRVIEQLEGAPVEQVAQACGGSDFFV